MALVNLKLTSTGSQLLWWEIPKLTNNMFWAHVRIKSSSLMNIYGEILTWKHLFCVKAHARGLEGDACM